MYIYIYLYISFLFIIYIWMYILQKKDKPRTAVQSIGPQTKFKIGKNRATLGNNRHWIKEKNFRSLQNLSSLMDPITSSF